MAKMFYSLEEAALKLGATDDQIREMAASGQLQQFRDRDKIMFKREQIDDLAEEQAADEESADTSLYEHLIGAGDDGTIPLVEDDFGDKIAPDESGLLAATDTDVIDSITIPTGTTDTIESTGPEHPADETAFPLVQEPEADFRQAPATVPPSDDLADLSPDVTQIAEPPLDLDEEEGDDLVLEQVGSGSGLLDLTRESDDTSLGAELLDEIYPGDSDDSGAAVAAADADDTVASMETAITSSSIFDGSVELDISTSGLENLQDAGEPSSVVPSSMAVPAPMEPTVTDYAGNGLSIGMLSAALVSLGLVFIVLIYALTGVPSSATASISRYPLAYSGGLLVLAIVLGLAGMFFGKVQKQ